MNIDQVRKVASPHGGRVALVGLGVSHGVKKFERESEARAARAARLERFYRAVGRPGTVVRVVGRRDARRRRKVERLRIQGEAAGRTTSGRGRPRRSRADPAMAGRESSVAILARRRWPLRDDRDVVVFAKTSFSRDIVEMVSLVCVGGGRDPLLGGRLERGAAF